MMSSTPSGSVRTAVKISVSSSIMRLVFVLKVRNSGPPGVDVLPPDGPFPAPPVGGAPALGAPPAPPWPPAPPSPPHWQGPSILSSEQNCVAAVPSRQAHVRLSPGVQPSDGGASARQICPLHVK